MTLFVGRHIKDKSITFKVTDHQRKLIQVMAQSRNMSVSEMIMRLLDAEYKDPVLSNVSEEASGGK